MDYRNRFNRSLGLLGIGTLLSLSPLACSDDDGDDGPTGGRGGSGGAAGTGGGAGDGGGLAGGGYAGSGDEGGAGGSAGAGGAPDVPLTARLRVVHASPSAPAIDIYLRNASEAAASDVAYGDTTGVLEVEAGTLAFDLRAAGADADGDPALTTEPIELVGGAEYTVVAAGDFAELDDVDTGFRLLALEHDFEPASAGQALVRLVHAAPAWAEVDIDVLGTEGVDLPSVTAFSDESNVQWPAEASIDITVTSEADGESTRLRIPEVEAGAELFVIATGNPGRPFRAPENGFALLTIDQDGAASWIKEDPWVHVLHASDVGSVDLYDVALPSEEEKLADDLDESALARFQLPASDEGFELKAVTDDAASGAATSLATGETGAVEAGERYLSYVAGSGITTLRERFDLDQPTRALLRGVHAAPGIEQSVDFGTASSSALGTPLIVEVEPGQASAEGGVALNAGNVILAAAQTATTTPLLAEASFTGARALTAGERGFLLLVGEGSLWFVDTSVPGWSVR